MLPSIAQFTNTLHHFNDNKLFPAQHPRNVVIKLCWNTVRIIFHSTQSKNKFLLKLLRKSRYNSIRPGTLFYESNAEWVAAWIDVIRERWLVGERSVRFKSWVGGQESIPIASEPNIELEINQMHLSNRRRKQWGPRFRNRRLSFVFNTQLSYLDEKKYRTRVSFRGIT